jgi:transcriptional regulator with XRE-family HTH domain
MMQKTFGDRVHELRQRAGWTQAMLANKAGASATQVSEWERSKEPPRGKHLLALADAFGVTVDYLLGRNNPAAYGGKKGAKQ